MEPILLKIELSATPELLNALNGLSALATAMLGKHSKDDQAETSSNFEAVTNRVKELIASGKKKEVTELLKEYGVRKASDLNTSLYKDFLEKSENLTNTQRK